MGGVASSRVSRHQEVCMSANGASFDTVWRCAAQNTAKRFQLDTQPVPASTPLLLLHAATAQALSSSPLRYLNDFGAEFEVCAHTHTHTAKSQGLQAERLGVKVGEEVARREWIDNHWALLTASTPERELILARDEAEVLRLIQQLVQGVRDTLMGAGVRPLQRLSLDLWKADRERNDCLPYSAFSALLAPLLPALTPSNAALLCKPLRPGERRLRRLRRLPPSRARQHARGQEGGGGAGVSGHGRDGGGLGEGEGLGGAVEGGGEGGGVVEGSARRGWGVCRVSGLWSSMLARARSLAATSSLRTRWRPAGGRRRCRERSRGQRCGIHDTSSPANQR